MPPLGFLPTKKIRFRQSKKGREAAKAHARFTLNLPMRLAGKYERSFLDKKAPRDTGWVGGGTVQLTCSALELAGAAAGPPCGDVEVRGRLQVSATERACAERPSRLKEIGV